jgi:hypothetical protein
MVQRRIRTPCPKTSITQNDSGEKFSDTGLDEQGYGSKKDSNIDSAVGSSSQDVGDEKDHKPQWKNQVKSQSGRKGAEKKNRTESAAESAAELEHDKEEADAMIVTTDGTVEPDPAGAKDGLTGQLQQPPPPYHPSAEQEITGDAGVSAKQLGVRKEDKVEFRFWLSFDELHAEMQRRFEKDGAAARIWIGGVIDTSTGNVLSKWVGSDKEEISDEPANGS